MKRAEMGVTGIVKALETTSPTIAVAVIRSREEKIRNLFFLNNQKRVPPALRALTSRHPPGDRDVDRTN